MSDHFIDNLLLIWSFMQSMYILFLTTPLQCLQCPLSCNASGNSDEKVVTDLTFTSDLLNSKEIYRAHYEGFYVIKIG